MNPEVLMPVGESWKWTFSLKEGTMLLFSDKKEGKSVLQVKLTDGLLTAEFAFSVREKPLTLKAAASVGDTAEIIYRPYRIELFVNGILMDEEWQFGEALFKDSVLTVSNVKVGESPAPPEKEMPSVCGTFTGAEGWMPGNGVFCGDCMPYSDGERYHVLYLKDRHHHGSKWGLGAHQWAHISTRDMTNWDIHPMAVPIDDPSEASICTGSWIYDGGKYVLYYTVRTTDGSPAPIKRSVSEDGYHFRKDRDFGFTLSDRYCGARARDPKAVRGADGLLHLFVTTTDETLKRGCLAHLVSEDSENFREIGNIYTSPDESEPECPDYFSYNGKYYIVFSHRGKGQYLMSDEPFAGWKAPEDGEIPCHGVPKCAVWRGRIIFTGFKPVAGYAGTLTFREAKQLEDGRLEFSAEC